MDIRKVNLSYRSLGSFFYYLKFILFIILFSACLLLLNKLEFSNYFLIKDVKVYGINKTDREEVRTLLMPLVDHNFFTINIEYIRDRLLQIPWVSQITVRRNWPDQIEIAIKEKNAVVVWNENSLLSDSGEIFTPNKITFPQNLPQFKGPQGQQMLMLRYFQQISDLFYSIHKKIAYLELTPFFTWKLKLDNGIVMQIGHKDILTRLAHFVKVYPKIVAGRDSNVEYIDLRYANGVAVKWKA